MPEIYYCTILVIALQLSASRWQFEEEKLQSLCFIITYFVKCKLDQDKDELTPCRIFFLKTYRRSGRQEIPRRLWNPNIPHF
jgi:hypothetical protein